MDGVWRTIGGRRVFIKTGQSLSNAMKDSGKFKLQKLRSEKEEMVDVFNKIEEEMLDQNLHTYDINSNDTNEMLFFIDTVVKPIVNNSNLNENKKREIIGYMIMDINDNKRWSIKTGVKTIKEWYKI